MASSSVSAQQTCQWRTPLRVELKTVKAQCLNYLDANDLRPCLSLNFGQPRL